MRYSFLCSLIFLFSNYLHAQQSREELLQYLSQYEEGDVLDDDSWLINTDGDTVLLSQFKGKWVLIDYWSVTCRPCLQEMPYMEDFSASHSIKSLQVIAVSVDPDHSKWVKLGPKRVSTLESYFAGRSSKNDLFGMNLSLLEDKGKYNLITTLPRYTLIDPNGRIAKKDLKVKPSSPDFSSYIRELIN